MSRHVAVLPPWHLTGSGFIVLYWVNQESPIRKQYPEHSGNIAALMLVDYEESPVGPYKEVLWIPGKLNLSNSAGYNIGYIRVNSEQSTENGRANWGIPKSTCEIVTSLEGTFELKDDDQFLQIQMKSSRMHLPFITSWLPYRLVQLLDNRIFVTRPTASGSIALGSLKSIKTNIDALGCLTGLSPFLVICANRFKMTFPVPKIFSI